MAETECPGMRKRPMRIDPTDGQEMHALARELFPFHRSVTGSGVRQTLSLLGREIPIEVHEVPSGTKVYDWTVPKEWRLAEAYILDEAGERVIDASRHNLHIAGYSDPVDQQMTWSELKGHLVTLPQAPDWIPFRSRHFTGGWAFCLSHRQYEVLEKRGERSYRVVVDSELKEGSLTYGEAFIPGETEDEILISTHVCHPSLANDNLSGLVVASRLARHVGARSNRYSYRFIFIPATIGAITWLARNEEVVARTKHGLVLSGLGDRGAVSYKRSRRGNAEVDRAVTKVLRDSGDPHKIRDFAPVGYDERQFCSPGINLPMGCFSRSVHGSYPEYHSSGDDLDFITPNCLADSLEKLMAIIELLERNSCYLSLNAKCEPQLGRRGLYRAFGTQEDTPGLQLATQWVLNFSDGEHRLLDIAERSDETFELISKAAELLLDCQLLRPLE